MTAATPASKAARLQLFDRGNAGFESGAVAIEYMRLADELFVQAVEDTALLDGARERDERAEHDHVRRAHVARLEGDIACGDVADAHVVTPRIAVGNGAVDDDDAAAPDARRPPLLTRGANLWKLGPFMAMSTSGVLHRGEAMGCSEMMTEQFAVPPRISGP